MVTFYFRVNILWLHLYGNHIFTNILRHYFNGHIIHHLYNLLNYCPIFLLFCSDHQWGIKHFCLWVLVYIPEYFLDSQNCWVKVNDHNLVICCCVTHWSQNEQLNLLSFMILWVEWSELGGSCLEFHTVKCRLGLESGGGFSRLDIQQGFLTRVSDVLVLLHHVASLQWSGLDSFHDTQGSKRREGKLSVPSRPGPGAGTMSLLPYSTV